MAAAGRRRGRRSNGLDAADWRAIEDLDPRVSEAVLDALAIRGIAGYVQPAMDVDPITRSATVPNRPTDRLYVDRSRVAAARELVRQLLAPGPARDLDVTFAGIVAGFDRPVDPAAADWPAAENVPGGPPATTRPAGAEPPVEPAPTEPPAPGPAGGPVDARSVTEPSLLDALDTFGADLPDQEPPERFVPPPPPPLPRLSRQTGLGALAVVVGLVLMLGGIDLPLDRSGTMLVGFATSLGGAVALILRLRPGTDPEEDPPPDDGAQV